MSNREMSEQDTQFLLGKLIGENSRRDAIHIAVAPGIANERLAPGEHIGIVGEFFGRSSAPLGIVDPFLAGPVFKGERFWMFLYPNTITSLRHQWTHPVFDNSASVSSVQTPKTDKREAEKWLRDFADRWGMKYNEMISGADNADYITAYGSDLHSANELGDDFEPFWEHMQTLMGKSYNQAHRATTGYSCSC